ncbi:Dyp-type peroxidase [Solirubrobacter sp. CPCC 204708]|uniref:Dyp-type peroxidase n=1 Tax=Solirubrobacter deserti TaxID=2282478 RepID=A0ABT4RLZ1_9ACTN|nr:Dyp-type peroxidase domain-containing protein [Solirubrobacter deserti]MBE2318975.1 Dyp-type peroxidase [Solirubrobacter deserti]MDA0139300.1 Dyp-type peroxidase [Solirubrobacter deserti]
MLGRPPNVPRRKPRRADIDLGDIQGNVLRGYTHPAAAYLFLRIVDVDAARALMRRMLPQVMTAEPWRDGVPETAMNVAFTFSGLSALGLSPNLLESFPEAFREGMAARAERLGDRGPSAPSEWEDGLGTGGAHVLVTVYAVDWEHLTAAVRSVIGEDERQQAVTLVHLQRAEALPGGKDHFGFFDGIAQPAVRGAGVEPRPGDGQPDGAGGWRELATGEILLGYEDEDGTLPAAPLAPFERNGTFVVYRKLAMDTAAFRRFVDAQSYPGGPRQLAAKIVGRWPDGTPLALSPGSPDAAIASDPARLNNFGYADDPDGFKCPLGAHIRRANPRDSAGFFDGRLSNRHRLVRRGRAYGKPLPPGATEDDGTDRGLVFVCFQADIWRQFETVQALWIDDGDPFGLGRDKDFLVGEPHGTEGKMTIQGHPPHFLKPQPRFVTLRGGEYLFQPSMSALRHLSGAG